MSRSGPAGPLTTQNVPPYGREPLLATLAQSTATFPQNHYERDDGNALLHFDIHIEHKIRFEELPEVMPEEEFGKIVAAIADEVFASTMPHNEEDYLFIIGDTCESTHIGKLFYSRLVQLWKPNHIIATLGNHELWTAEQQWTDEDEKVKPNMKDIIAAWRRVFEKFGIIFLQNETYELPNENAVVLGGLGFSGRNDYFNACNGIYLRVLTSRRQDLIQSNAFDKVYKETVKRCEEEGKKLIVLTHNPWRDWHNGDIESEPVSVPAVYFSGHTHQNRSSRYDGVTGKKWFYEDGQIGYPPRSYYNIKMAYI